MPTQHWNVDDFLKQHKPKTGRTLVVGSKIYKTRNDRRALYPDAVGLDMLAGDGVDIVHDFENSLPQEVGQFNHIDCCSVLEHVKRPWVMAENIENALVPNGTLLLSVPFCWRVHGYPNDYWRFSIEAVKILFPRIKWKSIRYLINGQYRYKVEVMRQNDTEQWIERTETLAFGHKM